MRPQFTACYHFAGSFLLLICAILLLSGCANLPDYFTSKPVNGSWTNILALVSQGITNEDPDVVRAQNTLQSAQLSVASFLKLAEGSPDGNAKHLARSLEERFPTDAATLAAHLDTCRNAPKSDYARAQLLQAIDPVRSARDMAEMHLAGSLRTPLTPPPPLSKSDSEINSIWLNVHEMRAMLEVMATNINQLKAIQPRRPPPALPSPLPPHPQQ